LPDMTCFGTGSMTTAPPGGCGITPCGGIACGIASGMAGFAVGCVFTLAHPASSNVAMNNSKDRFLN
jgi:hypothetical protein